MKYILPYIIIISIGLFLNSCSEKNQEETQTSKIICEDPNFDLMKSINISVEKWTGTPYSTVKGTDCSGIFHKVINDLRKECPNAKFPSFEVDRSSRGIASWYFKNGNFTFIRNPEVSDHLIRPGIIMFYGKGGRNYDLQTMNIETLTNHSTGVHHVAIVTSVNRNEKGKVISYEIFHGLNPKKPAKTTTEVYKNPRRPNHPPYAHWNQPWLAIATIF